MRGVTLAWITFLGLATWRYEQGNPGTLPPPSLYIGSSVIFSLFGLLAQPAPELAAVLGWGLVVAGVTTGTGLPSGTGAITAGTAGGSSTPGGLTRPRSRSGLQAPTVPGF